MHFFIIGATGFFGRALVLRLQRDGHTITAWVRDEERARGALGAAPRLRAAVPADVVAGWPAADAEAMSASSVSALPVDHCVGAVPVQGGSTAAADSSANTSRKLKLGDYLARYGTGAAP